MDNAPNLRLVTGQAVYALIAVVLIFLAILPLDRSPGALPGPDLLLAVTYVWVIRRPDLAPVWLITAVFLLADAMLTRPPGLWTAGVVLTTEYLRSRSFLTTEVSFAMEWAVAASMIASVMVGTSTVSAVLGPLAPGLGALLVKLVGTVLIYPVVVAVARFVFGMRRAAGARSSGMRGVR